MQETLLTILQRAAERRADEPIYRFLVTGDVTGPQQTLSAVELQHDAQKIANAVGDFLKDRPDPSPRVVLACQSPIDFARAFFGILTAGAVPVPADPPSLRPSSDASQALRAILADAQPSLLISNSETMDDIGRLALPLEQTGSSCALRSVEELISAGGKEHRMDASPDDLALLQYTSGSTSSPRGVMITHANLLSNLCAIERMVAPPPGAIGVTWLPLSHDLGLIGSFLFTLFASSGSLVVMTPGAFAHRPVRWLQAISHFRAWGTSAPHFAFALCNRVVKEAQLANLDFSSLECALCGAEPIDPETLHRFSQRLEPYGFRSAAIRPCYGLAEATLLVSAAPSSLTAKTFDSACLSAGHLETSESGRTIASCGVLQDDLRMAIVDPASGRRCMEGQIGEIWISGASVGKGYFRWSTQKNDSVFRATLSHDQRKYLRTGDLGASYDGELYVTGRCKDVVIIRGKNFDAHDLERIAVSADPRLYPGCVVAFAEFDQSESIVVLAEVRWSQEEKEYSIIAQRIQARLLSVLGIQADKVAIIPSKSIALTATAKLRRAETRRRYQSGSIEVLYAGSSAEWHDNTVGLPHLDRTLIEEMVLREIRVAARLEEQEPLAKYRRLSELAIDSLGMAQLATALAQFSPNEAPWALLEEDPTVSALIDRLHRHDCTANYSFQNGSENSASEDVFAPARAFKLADRMRQADLLPFYQPFSNWEGTHATLDGRRVLILGSFDYLGLSRHPRVREAAARAACDMGTGRSSSRVHSATTPEVLAMEQKLARFLHRQDALVCTTGYQALAAVVTSFMNARTTLVADEQIHASILDGAAIARCRVRRFAHNNPTHLEELLNQTRSAMVIVEGLYSNAGDIPPLAEIREICSRHRARLTIDDAHAFGVLGFTGRGTEEHVGSRGACDLIAGTFSKTLASIGGWIAGDHDIIDYVRYHARPVLFTAGIAPPMLAAASAALDILIEQPDLPRRLGTISQCFRDALQRCGVPVTGQGPIFRLLIGDDERCVRFARELLRRGIYAHTVLYPSVPPDGAMLRFSVSAAHDPAELSRAAECVAECCHTMDRRQTQHA